MNLVQVIVFQEVNQIFEAPMNGSGKSIWQFNCEKNRYAAGDSGKQQANAKGLYLARLSLDFM